MSDLTKDDFEKIVFSGNETVRANFQKEFNNDIKEFILRITKTYDRLQNFSKAVHDDLRLAWVYQFLFNAFNSLLTSLHLLISGFAIPAGNLMRHFAESISVALLFSHPKIDEFDHFRKDMRHYPVHKALSKVLRNENKKLLNIDPDGWQRFMKITKFFDHFSHPSALAVAYTQIFEDPGGLIVGSEFDPKKKEQYHKHIKLILSGCNSLIEIIEHIESILKKEVI
jgi:hypothetical protein